MGESVLVGSPKKFRLQTDIQNEFYVQIGLIMVVSDVSVIILKKGYHNNFQASKSCC